MNVTLCKAKVDAINAAIKMIIRKLIKKETNAEVDDPIIAKIADSTKTEIKKRVVMARSESIIGIKNIRLAAKLDLIDLKKL